MTEFTVTSLRRLFLRQFTGRSSRRGGSLLAIGAVLFALVVPVLAVPARAHAATPADASGWIRLGHLAPNTPAVDIYLSQFGQPQKVAFRKAGYGNVTPYSALQPGLYTVSMRPASAPASSPPALSADVQVKSDTTNTLLVFQNGPNGTIRGQMFTDDLTAPPSGSGRVRVVQGAPEPDTMDVTATSSGTVLASGLKYGDAGDYVTLPQGRVDLTLRHGTASSPVALDVRSASVSTVVVLAKPGGTLALSELRDATGVANAPTGGAATGGGGTALSGFPLVPVVLVGLVVGGLVVLAGRRSSPRPGRGARA
jgi:hypothetical protein